MVALAVVGVVVAAVVDVAPGVVVSDGDVRSGVPVSSAVAVAREISKDPDGTAADAVLPGAVPPITEHVATVPPANSNPATAINSGEP